MARFIVLYYSHILTTIPIPLALLILNLVSPRGALALVLFLAGFWTLVGALTMVSRDTRQLRRLFAVMGIVLVLLSPAALLL
jgi:hypothetical protein